MLGSYILKLVILLPLVCGLMIGCLYLWKRLESRMPGRKGGPSERLIQVRETMMLSPGLRLAVLEFEGRRLLVSVGRGGVNLIDRDSVPTPPAQPGSALRASSFVQGLGGGK